MKNQQKNSSNRKTKNNLNRFAGRKKNIFWNRKVTSIFMVAILALGLYTVAIKNVPGLNPFQAHATPTYRICTLANTVLCLNRKGGGTGYNTPVIGWADQSDQNDGFYFATMPFLCGTGHVRDYNPAVAGDVGCPFTTKTLNHGNRGRLIVKLEEWTGGGGGALCVADPDGNGSGNLGWCPDAHGYGGTAGAMFVAMNTSQTDSSLANGTQLVNVYWSDQPEGGFGIEGRWLCLHTNGNPAWLTWNPQQVQSIGTQCYFKQYNYYIAT
jgi:hypothetical protein